MLKDIFYKIEKKRNKLKFLILNNFKINFY